MPVNIFLDRDLRNATQLSKSLITSCVMSCIKHTPTLRHPSQMSVSAPCSSRTTLSVQPYFLLICLIVKHQNSLGLHLNRCPASTLATPHWPNLLMTSPQTLSLETLLNKYITYPSMQSMIFAVMPNSCAYFQAALLWLNMNVRCASPALSYGLDTVNIS